jgi:hypothetical protein
MSYLQLLIINRSGGLVYSKNLSKLAPTLTTNDSLRLGSTFHGLHAIATQIAPCVSQGISKMELDTFKLNCFQTLTGVKFVITATPIVTDLESLLQNIYELYSDYVVKNPFYEIDMPIRCDLFNINLDRLMAKVTATQQGKRRPN